MFIILLWRQLYQWKLLIEELNMNLKAYLH